MQSDVVTSIDTARAPYLEMLPSTHELDAQMHYAAFSPLPTRIGNAFYRNESDHALVFLSYPEHLNNQTTVDDDIETLADVLHSIEQLRSLTFICESLSDVRTIQLIADSLSTSLGIKPAIWGLRKGDYHDMFSIMSKADVVLFGGNALYTDAIIRGMPVFAWRTNQPGTDAISNAYRAFSDDRDFEKLKASQRAQLDRVFEAQYLDATIPNHRVCFHNVLEHVIQQAVYDSSFTIGKKSQNQPDWVIAPARMSENRSMPDKLSRSVWNDRQTLLKFKQPKNRAVIRNERAGDQQVFTRIK